jgi:CubicO group peptidase (beta-lactamase class C family)
MMRISKLLLLLGLLAGAQLPADAQQQPQREAQPPSSLGDPRALEVFTDGTMAGLFSAYRLVGATVAIVEDGEIVLAKGYGQANIASGKPVDPATTLFRPGSVSKLFTWTAIMQLVERGRIDLDTDVNRYLKRVRVPEAFGKPVTVRNLLTHSGGFEDGGLGFLFRDAPEKLQPLEQALIEHMPRRVRPPTTDFDDGTRVAYSNWGTALAGQIVADVSGLDFDTYVDRNILAPLAMRHSSFREPLPAPLKARMATGYTVRDGRFVPGNFEYIHSFGPAGSLSASGTDMANFMIAHLALGRFGEARILSDATARKMQSNSLVPHPEVSAAALGFYETRINGHRTIGHGGATAFFKSDLVLIPEAGVGLYVSFNSPDGTRAARDLKLAFMQRYFPHAGPPLPRAASDPAEAVGTYRTLRRSYSLIDKALSAGNDIDVRALENGNLLIAGLLGDTAEWRPIGNGAWQRLGRSDTAAFIVEPGRPTTLVGPFVFMPSERIAWWQAARVHALAAGASVLVLLSFLFGFFYRTGPAPNGFRWYARPIMAGAAIANLAFLGAAAATASLGDRLVNGLPGFFRVALALPILSILLTTAALLLAIRIWRGGLGTRGARLHYSFAILASALFLAVLGFWNLIGWNYT